MPRIQAWNIIRPIEVTKAINQSLVLTAFGSIEDSLFTEKCLFFSSATVDTGLDTNTDISSCKSAFTVEAWIKIITDNSSSRTILAWGDIALAFDIIKLSVEANKLKCSVRKATVTTSVTSALSIPDGEWCHVCATYDGTTVKLYINGVEDANTLAVAANLDTFSITQGMQVGQSLSVTPSTFRGYIDECIWRNAALTATQVVEQYTHPKNQDPTSSVQSEILSYYTWNDAGPLYHNKKHATNTINLSSSGDIEIVTTAGAPLIFGASVIKTLYEVTIDVVCAIVFPIDIPEDTNFGVFVSWLDGNEVLQRRKLYDPGCDINLPPEAYRGETLPVNFTIEIWNIDGEPSVDMEDDLTIQLSILEQPTTQYDHTGTETAISDNQDIYEPFPLTGFPLLFDQPKT